MSRTAELPAVALWQLPKTDGSIHRRLELVFSLRHSPDITQLDKTARTE
jgi:hypothetical protein